jgi:O-antigen/teichoic acid export membrane protein
MIELPRVLVGASLQASRRMLALTRIENGQEVVRVFLVVLGALLTGRVEGAVIGTLAASLFGSLMALDLYRRERREHGVVLPALREVLRHVRDVPLRQGLPLGLKMGAIQNLTAIANQILPTLLMQRFGSPEWVAYLRIAQRIMNVPYTFVHAIGRTANPIFSRYAGQKDVRGLRRAHWRASLYSGLTVTTGILLCLPLIPIVVGRLFPVDYHEPVWLVSRILVLGFVLMSFCVASDTFYLVTNTLRVAIQLSLAGTVVNTVVIATLAWRFPTVGVAWGLVITMSMGWMHLIYAWSWYRKHPDPPAAG